MYKNLDRSHVKHPVPFQSRICCTRTVTGWAYSHGITNKTPAVEAECGRRYCAQLFCVQQRRVADLLYEA